MPGYNATSHHPPSPVDDNGHGTMTLGIIAAAANNGAGIAGVGWNVKAMPVKVLGRERRAGTTADIAEGIDWAVGHGAKVINMSLGGPGSSSVLATAVEPTRSRGVSSWSRPPGTTAPTSSSTRLRTTASSPSARPTPPVR